MAKEFVCDELREMIEPLPPEETPKPEGGRPRVDEYGMNRTECCWTVLERPTR